MKFLAQGIQRIHTRQHVFDLGVADNAGITRPPDGTRQLGYGWQMLFCGRDNFRPVVNPEGHARA